MLSRCLVLSLTASLALASPKHLVARQSSSDESQGSNDAQGEGLSAYAELFSLAGITTTPSPAQATSVLDGYSSLMNAVTSLPPPEIMMALSTGVPSGVVESVFRNPAELLLASATPTWWSELPENLRSYAEGQQSTALGLLTSFGFTHTQGLAAALASETATDSSMATNTFDSSMSMDPDETDSAATASSTGSMESSSITSGPSSSEATEATTATDESTTETQTSTTRTSAASAASTSGSTSNPAIRPTGALGASMAGLVGVLGVAAML